MIRSSYPNSEWKKNEFYDPGEGRLIVQMDYFWSDFGSVTCFRILKLLSAAAVHPEVSSSNPYVYYQQFSKKVNP